MRFASSHDGCAAWFPRELGGSAAATHAKVASASSRPLSAAGPGVIIVGNGGGCGSTLVAGEELPGGTELCSPDGSYTLDAQSDGNLVEYNSSGTAPWASGICGIGCGSAYLSIQNDSNVVLYDNSGAIWAVRDFSPQAYAQEIMFHFGWNESQQWPYLDQLRQDESSWEWYVCYGGGTYPSCDYTHLAYGIPQAYPGDKMASVWPDWATDPFTQITWGEEYIAGTYGNPENAWNHEVTYGSYATPKLS